MADLDDADLKQQMARLEAARRDPKLLAQLPRVVAAEFGAVPIGERPDGALEVAVGASVTPRVVAGLERVLGRKVVSSQFEEGLIHLIISRLYLRKEELNFHTFLEEDFLERPDAAKLLAEEKEKEPVRPRVAIAADRLALLDYAYRSVLESLDGRSGGVNFEEQKEAAIDLAFRVEERPEAAEPWVELAREGDLPAQVYLLAQESYSYAGLQHMHGWRAHEVAALPLMIHPTEIQVTAVEADGSIDVLVYDKIERVRPGETPRFDITYYFISMGQRLKRKLTLKVYGLWCVPREGVRRAPGPIPWEPKHLERWLGHDL